MSTFVKGGSTTTPFGRNEYLRSTNPKPQFESYTVAASTVPARTIDGNAGQKILQPGTVMAKITSGPEAGKIGPFQAAGTAEVTTLTPTGTISGGTFRLTLLGVQTGDIAFNATAAQIEAAIDAAIPNNSLVVAGGPISTTAVTLTYSGAYGDVAQATVQSSLTGSSPVITPTTTTAGVAGASDGRGVLANIVGLNDTFLPWQLIERDVEVAVAYTAAAVQAWCKELDASGAEIALTNTTADAMRGTKGLDILFK